MDTLARGAIGVHYYCMMQVIWEFKVRPERVREFESHYAGAGAWAQLFRRSEAYLGTELWRDSRDDVRFLTLDRWRDASSYESFWRQHEQDYRRLDETFEELTESERLIGVFELS